MKRTVAPPSILIIFIAAIGAIVAAVLLIPNDKTRAVSALRDGHFGEALHLLEQASLRDQDPNAQLQLYRLYVHFGEPVKAGLTLQTFVDRNPDEIDVLEELVSHYRQAHDEEKYIGALRRLFERRPSRPTYAALIGHFRLVGNVEGELEVFGQAQVFGLASEEDRVRAGSILAASGKATAALALLKDVDFAKISDPRATEFAVFRLLMDLARIDDAYGWASQAIRTEDDRKLFADFFERAGQPSYAARLRRSVITAPAAPS